MPSDTTKNDEELLRGIANSERLLDLSNQLLDSYNTRKKSLKEINTAEKL
jgi:hypothetical protein